MLYQGGALYLVQVIGARASKMDKQEEMETQQENGNENRRKKKMVFLIASCSYVVEAMAV